MNGDRDSTDISPNDLVQCSPREAIGIACRVSLIVHLVASVLLFVIGWIMLLHGRFGLECCALIVGVFFVQLATLFAIMLPSAFLIGVFAQFYFQQPGFAVERAIWLMVLTGEANLVGWIVLPWFVGSG